MSDEKEKPEKKAEGEKAEKKAEGEKAEKKAEGEKSDKKAEGEKSEKKAAEPEKKSSLASNALFLVLFVATLGLGYWGGQKIQEWRAPKVDLNTGDRYKVELRGDEPQMGPDDALVTIIEFSDFQCPYCAKAAGPLKEVKDKFGDDVRVIFKHYPLPGHSKAIPAAKISYAAHKQGHFLTFHDALFEGKGDIDAETLSSMIESNDLDAEKFAKDMESEAAQKSIDSDHIAGGKVGVNGTPSFIVNGHSYSGALGYQAWRQIVQAELDQAREVEASGVDRGDVYDELMKNAQEVRGGGKAVGGKPSERKARERRPGEPHPDKSYRVPTGNDRPQLGPDDALVTIVEFADFHCPFCARAASSIKTVQKKYDKDVRLVFRQRPLSMHPHARDAARAALAAHRQGKFWEMHDLLYEKQPKDLEGFKKLAKRLELDEDQFVADFEDESGELEEWIKLDETVATHFGSGGTPAFFINGRFISGAQPYNVFDDLVKEELAKARALMVKESLPREQVYDRVLELAEPEVTD